MSMKTSKKCHTFLVLIVTVVLTGCAVPAKRLHTTFVPPNTRMIKKGMTPSEIESMFGLPELKYTTQFGDNTQIPWEGLVYKYHTVPDPMYQYVERYLTNTFVFYLGSNPPKLNHWVLEHVYSDSD